MPTLMENIPEELRGLQRWVCANADSKRPMRCWEGKAASVSKPSTWGDFDEAESAVEQGIYEYAGFAISASTSTTPSARTACRQTKPSPPSRRAAPTRS